METSHCSTSGVSVTHYRYRGDQIPTPGQTRHEPADTGLWRAGCGNAHVRAKEVNTNQRPELPAA
jgi:hypothetical protein